MHNGWLKTVGRLASLGFCTALSSCGGGGDTPTAPTLADYTFYVPGAGVAYAPISGEIPATGIFRTRPDGTETHDALMHCVSVPVSSGAQTQRSDAVGVLSSRATALTNANALAAAGAGKIFYYAENCTYLTATGTSLTPPLSAEAISMVVDETGSRISNGPSNTPAEVDAVLSTSGMTVSDGPRIHWFAYQVGTSVVIVNTTNYSTSRSSGINRVGLWIAQ
ncbi:hypothetical protein [Ottowia thiooxydans]|uniref:hypothetical protein n=1 Tax=Ottowia thiooxydans TaxID=219182 RepID=UPI000490058E|nr:hypothetical protein [Ottowia thiooxydans]